MSGIDVIDLNMIVKKKSVQNDINNGSLASREWQMVCQDFVEVLIATAVS